MESSFETNPYWVSLNAQSDDELINLACGLGILTINKSRLELINEILQFYTNYAMQGFLRYGQKIETLGRGSYGKVQLYQRNEQQFAIKSSEYFEPALVETVALTYLNSPYIIKPIDVTFRGDQLLIVMPRAQSDLNTLRTQLDLSQIPHYAMQIALGIAHAHNANILNLDLKPHNILYFPDNTVKIADWGIAKLKYCSYPRTTIGEVFTLWYRPPEILLGDKRLNPVSEIWAFGCILAELYSRKVLFTGDSEIDQLYKIFRRLGTPNSINWPGVMDLPYYKSTSPKWQRKGFPELEFQPVADLLNFIFQYNPDQRPNIFQVIAHPYFDSVRGNYIIPCVLSCGESLTLRQSQLISPNLPDRPNYINYLFRTARELQLSDRTFVLATTLFDNLLTKSHRLGLNLLADLCIYIASIFTESEPDLLDIIKKYPAFSKNSIEDGRKRIIQLLNFDLMPSTSYDFVTYYSKFYDDDVTKLAQTLILVFLLTDLPFQYLANQLAFLALLLGCRYYNKPYLHSTKFNLTEVVDQLEIIPSGLITDKFNAEIGTGSFKIFTQTIK